MDTETPTKEPAPNAVPSHPSFPTSNEILPEPASWLSAKFIFISVLLIAAAAVAGSLKSGKLTLTGFHAKVTTPAQAPATRPAPVAPPKPGAFVVTSISIGQPSFAIINGVSHTEGDPVEAPGETGWKVRQIVDGAVWLQNGTTLASLPLSTPGIKPLDDHLHPLN